MLLTTAATTKQQIIKVVLTRGQGRRGYNPHGCNEPNIYISEHQASHPKEHQTKGIKVYNCQTRLAKQPLLAGIKHLNRLEQVMARSEWQDDDMAEGIMRDYADNFISGTMSNLFIVKGKTLITPCLEQCGIEGVMRNYLMSLATNFGLTVLVKNIQLPQLKAADEIFLTNSIHWHLASY